MAAGHLNNKEKKILEQNTILAALFHVYSTIRDVEEEHKWIESLGYNDDHEYSFS